MKPKTDKNDLSLEKNRSNKEEGKELDERTLDTMELLKAYVLCPKEELTEGAIEMIRMPILVTLNPLITQTRQEEREQAILTLDNIFFNSSRTDPAYDNGFVDGIFTAKETLKESKND